jgi:nucleotide-binding universal stress UspA family protein
MLAHQLTCVQHDKTTVSSQLELNNQTTDFSENSKQAFVYAAKIAKLMNAEILLLHANQQMAYALPVSEYYAMEIGMEDQFHKAAARSLDDLLVEFKAEHPTISLSGKVEEGALYEVVRGVAAKEAVDIVVMGTKGMDSVADFFVGSNTEKVVRTAPCKVLAVPENVQKFQLKTVVFPSTLSHEQLPAFQQLAEWQAIIPFEVKLLYINNPLGISDEVLASNKKRLCELSGLISIMH